MVSPRPSMVSPISQTYYKKRPHASSFFSPETVPKAKPVSIKMESVKTKVKAVAAANVKWNNLDNPFAFKSVKNPHTKSLHVPETSYEFSPKLGSDESNEWGNNGGQAASSENSSNTPKDIVVEITTQDGPSPQKVLKIGSLSLDKINDESITLIDQYVRSLEDELQSKKKFVKVLLNMFEDSQARFTELKETMKLDKIEATTQTSNECTNCIALEGMEKTCKELTKSIQHYESNYQLLRERNKSLEEDLNIVLDRLIADNLSPSKSELRSSRKYTTEGSKKVGFNPEVEV